MNLTKDQLTLLIRALQAEQAMLSYGANAACSDEEQAAHLLAVETLCSDLQRLEEHLEHNDEVHLTIKQHMLHRPRTSADNGPYMVTRIGSKQWIIVERANPDRPISERIYRQATHAHRQKRKLNESAKKIDEMIKRDGAIIL